MKLADNTRDLLEIDFEPPIPIDDLYSRVLGVTVEEGSREPGRFEIVLADPQLQYWALTPSMVGRSVKLGIDGGPAFKGVVAGKRLKRDANSGTECVLWGFDFGVRLLDGPHFRAYPDSSIDTIIQSMCSQAGLRSRIGGLPETRISRQQTTIVQYDESNLDFLIRQGSLIGADLWFWRGELFFGDGPGTGSPLELDITKSGGEAGTVFLDEDWADEPAAYLLPIYGTPFKGAPTLPEFNRSEPLPATRAEPKAEASERGIFDKLRLGAISWPGGVAVSQEQQSSVGSMLAANRRDRRLGGAIHWRGALPKGATPGRHVHLVASGSAAKETIGEAVIFGLKVSYSGRSKCPTWVIQLGRLGPIREPLPNLRPAQHLWPARVLGDYDKEIGAISVVPIGWHAQSRLRARILSSFGGTELSTISMPRSGDLGLIGFEGGSPDAPVWIGSIHEKNPPDAISPEGNVRGAARFDGDATASWATEANQTPKKISINLHNIELQLTTDAVISLSTTGQFNINAELFNVKTTGGDISLTSKKAITLASDNIKLK